MPTRIFGYAYRDIYFDEIDDKHAVNELRKDDVSGK